jgi:hypothetical protein
MVVVASPLTPRFYDFLNRVPFSNVMCLPKANDAEPQRVAVSALFPLLSDPVVLPEGQVVQQSRGNLFIADWRAMVDKLRREDRPIHFFERVETMPGASRANLVHGLARGAKLRD